MSDVLVGQLDPREAHVCARGGAASYGLWTAWIMEGGLGSSPSARGENPGSTDATLPPARCHTAAIDSPHWLCGNLTRRFSEACGMDLAPIPS